MTPHSLQVLYSDLVTLLEGGRVRAARLEAGTSRLFFDVTRPTPPQQQQQVLQPAAAAAPAESAPAVEATAALAAAAAGSVGAAATPPQPTSSALAAAAPGSSGAAVGSGAAAGASSAALRQRFQKQFYVKLADKHDPVLLAKLLQVRVGGGGWGERRRRAELRGFADQGSVISGMEWPIGLAGRKECSGR
jgi:hypothetical protein